MQHSKLIGLYFTPKKKHNWFVRMLRYLIGKK